MWRANRDGVLVRTRLAGPRRRHLRRGDRHGRARPDRGGRRRSARAGGRDSPCWLDDSRPRQLSQSRLPSSFARPDAAGDRIVLDLARPDVRGGGATRPGSLSPTRSGDLCRDGPGRDHLRRRVPLPPSRSRRPTVLGRQRLRRGARRSRPRGRHSDRAARHVLPRGRLRPGPGRSAAALLRRRCAPVGRAGRGARGGPCRVGRRRRGSGDPLRARGAAGPDRPRRRTPPA